MGKSNRPTILQAQARTVSTQRPRPVKGRLATYAKAAFCLGLLAFVAAGSLILSAPSRRASASAASSSAFTGLWQTGVDSAHHKMTVLGNDPHWNLGYITNDYPTLPPCQGVPPGRAASVVHESGGSAGANGTWTYTSPAARWIAQNSDGLNDSTSSCPDPTAPGQRHAGDFTYANIYSFQMMNGGDINHGFYIDNTPGGASGCAYGIDMDSVKITIKGGVDNGVEFYVNKVQDGDWRNPGFTSGATTVSSYAFPTGTFQAGWNALTIRVKSTYPMTGLLVQSMTMSASCLSPLAPPTCTVNVPAGVEPGQSFTVSTNAAYSTSADASTAWDAGGRAIYSISSGASAAGGSLSGKNIAGTFTVPGQPPGIYTVYGGVTQSTAPGGNVICYAAITIGYHPYVSVTGGDISAGAGFGDSCADVSTAGVSTVNTGGVGGLYKGSSTNLAALAMDDITGFASGTDGVGGTSTSNLAQPAGLDFSNTTSPPGNIGALGCVPDYAGEAAGAAGAQVDNSTTGLSAAGLQNLASGVYVYKGPAARFTIAGGTIPADRSITIVVNSDVQINGDILYGAYASLDHAPHLTIIANGHNVYISHSVNTLTGFYVAEPGAGGGTMFTCTADSGSESIDPTICSGAAGGSSLTINGAVSAGLIRLDRTYSSLGGQPAEKIVFSPELWAAGLSGCGGSAAACSSAYASITDLPPVL